MLWTIRWLLELIIIYGVLLLIVFLSAPFHAVWPLVVVGSAWIIFILNGGRAVLGRWLLRLIPDRPSASD